MATQPTELYRFSDDTGLTIPDTADVRAGIVTAFKSPSLFGPNIDTSEETHIGRLIDEITELVVQTTGVNAQNANQFNLNYATGTFLDNLGAAFGVTRHAAAKSVVDVALTASQLTDGKLTVPAGTLFTSDDDYDFALVEDVVITNANATVVGGVTVYVANGTAQAVADGIVYCPQGTLRTIKTAVPNLVGVNNPTASSPWREAETDAHYRSRIREARYTGAASPSAILNALYALKDPGGSARVTDAVVLENGHAYPVVKRGVVLPAHAIFACVAGGGSVAEYAIAEAIYRTKTVGADYTKTTVSAAMQANRKDVTVTDSVTGATSVVSFFRPVERGLTVNVKADLSGYVGKNAQAAVESAIQAYLGVEGIGAEITEETLVSAIATGVADTIRVKELTMSYDGAPTTAVNLSAGEVFTLDTTPGASVRLAVTVVGC